MTAGVREAGALCSACTRFLAGFCPDICGQLPEKQRTAAGLAVSMVVLTSCNGDIEGAARAVASAAADGDLQAFGAGLSVGAAALTGIAATSVPADGVGAAAHPNSRTPLALTQQH
jgi:hypothetical protein